MSNQSKIFLVIISVILTFGVLTGCQDVAVEKVAEASKDSQINTIKTNQQLIARVISQEYATKGTVPTKEDVEKASFKSLEQLKIGLVFEKNRITIKNTDTKFTSVEIPDLVFDTQTGEIINQ